MLTLQHELQEQLELALQETKEKHATEINHLKRAITALK
jgi:hypothetical protein